MDGLTLLEEARKAGLEVRAEGDRLIIRGPKRLEPLARRLIEAKPAIMEALRRLCPDCLSEDWAWTHDGRRVCRRCAHLPATFGEACRPRSIPEAVAAEVRRIEAEALMLGWTERELWQAAGWVNALGLAALLKPGDAAEQVAADAITLRLRDGRRLRFYKRGLN